MDKTGGSILKKHVYFLHPDTIFLDDKTGSGVYCGLYNVTQEQIDFGHCAHPGDAIQIDEGKKQRYYSSREYKEIQRIAGIKAQLAEIDRKKIRAISDSILSGDNSRLKELEEQAEKLRGELKSE